MRLVTNELHVTRLPELCVTHEYTERAGAALLFVITATSTGPTPGQSASLIPSLGG
jgi:hypothetical protein